MKLVLQRVSQASVEVENQTVARIGPGLLILVGVAPGDGPDECQWLARKVAGMRIFEDDEGKMNRSLRDIDGECLAVSQFTLFADCRKGTRPGFSAAAPAEEGREGFETFVRCLRDQNVPVETGVFQAHMKVALVNDGPVTVLLERGGDLT